jgi:hypothetical protein
MSRASARAQALAASGLGVGPELQRPLLDLQYRHPVESAPVVGDHDQALAARVHCVVQIVQPDGRALGLQRRADLPAMLSGGT